jgi:thioredoxin reductase (NADPH)
VDQPVSGGIAAIVVVDDDQQSLALLERMIRRRFGADYDVVADGSALHALDVIGEMRSRGTDVALILADHQMPEMSGVDFLSRCVALCDDAKRAVLLGAGELNVARQEILRSAALGEIETYLVKPTRERDEAFYRGVGRFIEDWDRVHRPQFELIRIIGDPWDSEVHRIRDTLYRSGVPTGFYESDSAEGKRLLATTGRSGPLPAVITFDGQVVCRPSQAQLADLLGVNIDPTGHDFDVIVVGAGPAGLAAAVYGASEGLDVLILETEALGGQASTSSLIRNYLGFPRGLSGADLAARAYWQAWFFGAQFLLGRDAVGLRAEGDWRVVTLSDGVELRARAIVLASGVSYRRLGAAGLERFVGRGVYYGAPLTEAAGLEGEHVVVVGGGNSSAQSAIYLSRYAAAVTLVVRRAQLDEMSHYLLEDVEAQPNINVRLNTELVDAGGDTRLRSVTLHDLARDRRQRLDAAAVFILIGAEPRTDWLPESIERDERGYLLTGELLPADEAAPRRPFHFETSMPGVFAVGDVRLGGMKRVAAAVGDGSTAIRHVHEYLALVVRPGATSSGDARKSDS